MPVSTEAIKPGASSHYGGQLGVKQVNAWSTPCTALLHMLKPLKQGCAHLLW